MSIGGSWADPLSVPTATARRTGPVERELFMSHPSDPSIAQFSADHGVSTKTTRRWIAAGRLEAYRLGPRLIRIRAESIARLERPIGWAGSR